MKRFLIAVAVATAGVSLPAHAGDVAVSVSIGQPGFYGRIDIGGYPAPVVVYPQPVIVERLVPLDRPPIYLRVPPGHAKHWSKHCHEYNACGERVYFVRDNWYRHEYVPRYQEQHREHRVERRDERREDGHKQKKSKDHGNKHDKGRDRN